MITGQTLRSIAGIRKPHPLHDKIAAAFDKLAAEYGVSTQKAIAQFLANVSVETGGFTVLTENLNYSAKRLTQVWPKRFPTLASAAPYANNPRALANKVYGGRMGNTGPDDGFKFIGRGPGQATGKSNYGLCQKVSGIPFVSEPELMADPEKGMIGSLALWREWKLSGMAEQAGRSPTAAIRKRWNGGSHGLVDVKANYDRAMKINLSVSGSQPSAEGVPSQAAQSASQGQNSAPRKPVEVYGPEHDAPGPIVTSPKQSTVKPLVAGGVGAAIVVAFWSLFCSMPQFIINFLGYAGKCTGATQ